MSIEEIEIKINELGPLLDDIKYNRYFQLFERDLDYADYLNNKLDYFRVKNHLFFGGLKKIIVALILILLFENQKTQLILFLCI
jgi:hypothetical protein